MSQLFPRPTPMPLPPRQPSRFGSMQTDMARMQALNAKATAANRYNTDNPILTSDQDRYTDDNGVWNAESPTMPDPDKTTCFNEMTAAYSALRSEYDQLASAYEHLGVGQQDMASGDAATTDADKLAWYNLALNQFNAALDCCQYAESAHTTFDGHASEAETILARHG